MRTQAYTRKVYKHTEKRNISKGSTRTMVEYLNPMSGGGEKHVSKALMRHLRYEVDAHPKGAVVFATTTTLYNILQYFSIRTRSFMNI